MRCDPGLELLHDAYCLPALLQRKFTHAELWTLLGTVVDEGQGMKREEIGRSAEGRPIFAVHFGHGPARVLLWSQMHGDEPAHTMGLADLFAFFAREPDDERVRRLAEALTVVAVPMLNPDGAERFRRTNAQGLDVNRDARAWATPELRALRDLHARFRPDFALNLHDQDTRTRVGESQRLTAFALLANPSDEELSDSEPRVRAKALCAVVRDAVEPLVDGRIARFPDEFNPTGSGEYLASRGTPSVLLECGWWPEDPEKQFLRKLSFVAVLAALEAVADGSWRDAPLERYEELPENDKDVFDVLVRGGTVVAPGLAPFRADVGISFAAPLDLRDGTIAALGDLADSAGRRVVDASGLFVHPEPEALGGGDDGHPVLDDGLPASFTLRRGEDPESEEVLSIRRGVVDDLDATEDEDGGAGGGGDEGR